MTTTRTASLGMYDRAELHLANDALWAAIAGRLDDAGVRAVPRRLDRARPLAAIWDDPGLLLAQCCGYPLVTRWRGRLRAFATPRYRAAGCEGIRHRSRIVVAADDPASSVSALRGRRAAINERSSNSGMNLLRATIAPIAGGHPFFSAVIETGSHAASARLVAEGGAEVAAIDTVTYAHLERHEPAVARRLRTIGWTPGTPGLPLVTAAGTPPRDIAALRSALRSVAADPALAAARDALLIEGFDTVSSTRYEAVLRIEAKAARAGYPILA